MRWRQQRHSENIEDRRRMRVPGGAATAGVGGVGLLLLVLLAAVMGVDPTPLIESSLGSGPQVESRVPSAAEDQLAQFVSLVLADTEDTWQRVLADYGREYREPTLVLFTGSVQSACGFAESAVGPFYCPADGKVYLDTAFFDELHTRFGAPGDFAQAYVIAHEVGHHVQNLLGTTQQVVRLQQGRGQAERNALSIRLELQADCYAGVWANRAQETRLILDAGDLQEGLGAASAVGDDRIQMRSQGYVVPDSFTHGTSTQRVEWFQRGYTTGDPAACDTFAGS